MLSWTNDEDNVLSGATEVLAERLYYASFSSCPPEDGSSRDRQGRPIEFFSIDDKLVYWNFFLDFGPLNLGQLYRFCSHMNNCLGLTSENLQSVKTILESIRQNNHVVCYYSGVKGEQRANAVLLICAWQVLYLNKTPEEAFSNFRQHQHDHGSQISSSYSEAPEEQREPFPPFHDASPGHCTYQLSILDVLRGLAKARTYGFFKDFKTGNFDVDEYEHFEMVENGDLNWIIDGQFLAFAGPQNRREVSAEGYVTLTPEDYVDYFVRRNIGLVVRLNKKCYDETKFERFGISHVEHYYLDGSCPSKSILYQVVQSFEKCIFQLPSLRRTSKGVAVHCKAGLGRTGTCIGAFMMKHYRFSAAEAIGWMRLCRPGMVIGPQQHFLQNIEQEMWHEGEVMRMRVRKTLEDKNYDGGNIPPLDSDSPEELTTKNMSSDKKKRRSPRLKLSTTGFRNTFHSTGHDKKEEEGISQGDNLRAAHSRTFMSGKGRRS